MKRFGAFLVVSLLILTLASADNKKETERVENAGKVMKEEQVHECRCAQNE